MIGRDGAWTFKKDGSLKILAEFHESRILGFLAVMCVSQSRFYTKLSCSLNFFSYKVKRHLNILEFELAFKTF